MRRSEISSAFRDERDYLLVRQGIRALAAFFAATAGFGCPEAALHPERLPVFLCSFAAQLAVALELGLFRGPLLGPGRVVPTAWSPPSCFPGWFRLTWLWPACRSRSAASRPCVSSSGFPYCSPAALPGRRSSAWPTGRPVQRLGPSLEAVLPRPSTWLPLHWSPVRLDRLFADANAEIAPLATKPAVRLVWGPPARW